MGESKEFQKWAKFAASKVIAGTSKDVAKSATMRDEDLLFEGYTNGAWHKIE